MASKPLISVLMAVYNTQPEFLGRAMDSILKQTYKNIEFVIINDGSTDKRTLDMLYSFRDKRIRVIENKGNIGLTKSLIKGVGECRGTYIARMDADDVSAPGRLEKQLAYMRSNGLHIVGSNYAHIPGMKFHRLVAGSLVPLRMRLIFGNAAILHSSALWEKEYLGQIGIGYDAAFPKSQDYALWCSCAANGVMIGTHPEILVKWRESKGQISKKFSAQQTLCKKDIRRKYLLENFAASNMDLDFFVEFIDDSIFNKDRAVIRKAQEVLESFVAQNKQNRMFSAQEIYLFWLVQAFARLKGCKKADMVFCRFFLHVLAPVNFLYAVKTLRKDTVTVKA